MPCIPSLAEVSLRRSGSWQLEPGHSPLHVGRDWLRRPGGCLGRKALGWPTLQLRRNGQERPTEVDMTMYLGSGKFGNDYFSKKSEAY